MNFCSNCGQPVVTKIPSDDNRPRSVCEHCNTVHYENPRVVVGCIVEPYENNRQALLLCKRAIEPRHGYWTVPAGFLELEERTQDGAIRETEEEAGAKVKIHSLHSFFDLPQIGQVYVLYRAKLTDPIFKPGPESLEAQLFDIADIPWNDLAFPVVKYALELYLKDLADNQFRTHQGTIRRHREFEIHDPKAFTFQDHKAYDIDRNVSNT